MKLTQQVTAMFLSWSLMLVGVRDGFAQTAADTSQAPPQAAQQSPDQLQQLVAPIALYPDALIAQILPASTYPAEIVDAQRWMEPGLCSGTYGDRHEPAYAELCPGQHYRPLQCSRSA